MTVRRLSTMLQRSRIIAGACCATLALACVAARVSDATGCTGQERTQTEIHQCISAEGTEADVKLNRLLTELKGQLTAPQWSELAALQLQWRRFVAADYQWAASFFEGGSVQPALEVGCLRDHLNQRINWLKVFLCEGRQMEGACTASSRY